MTGNISISPDINQQVISPFLYTHNNKLLLSFFVLTAGRFNAKVLDDLRECESAKYGGAKPFRALYSLVHW